MSKPRILIVDDEPDVLDLLEFNLKSAGFEVVKAMDGLEALRSVAAQPPALIILDLMIPKIEGLEVCKTLRSNVATSRIPIIMLTARTTELDRVLGFELGADDYVTKPFSPRELILRVKGLLKRRQGAEERVSELLQVGELVVDIPRHEVTIKKRRVELTATEFKLITILLQRRGRVQSREQLLRDVWEYDSMIDTRTVDTHMRRLRDKLGSAAKYLDTVRGVGYRLVDEG